MFGTHVNTAYPKPGGEGTRSEALVGPMTPGRAGIWRRRLIVWGLALAAAGTGAVLFGIGGVWVTGLFFPEGERSPSSPATSAAVQSAVPTAQHIRVSLLGDAGGDALEPQEAEEAPLPPPAKVTPGLHPVLGATTNILLLGVDRNPGVRRGGLTDTLILAALDPSRKRLGLVSIPRDLYVDVENHGRARINAVYAYAKKDKLSPTAAFDRVLRDTLGVPVAHTVMIDLGLFERVIDELGGVDVDVPCPIRDRFLDGRVEGGRRLLDVAAGAQHMDGATAAMYVRSRHGRSDWSRARRQQAVLLGLRSKVTQPSVLLSLPQLLREWNDSVTTDLSPLQLLGLVRQVVRLDATRLHGVVLGHKETIPTRTEQQWSVLVPDEEAIARRLSGVYSAELPGRGTEVCLDADVALRRRVKKAAE